MNVLGIHLGPRTLDDRPFAWNGYAATQKNERWGFDVPITFADEIPAQAFEKTAIELPPTKARVEIPPYQPPALPRWIPPILPPPEPPSFFASWHDLHACPRGHVEGVHRGLNSSNPGKNKITNTYGYHCLTCNASWRASETLPLA